MSEADLIRRWSEEQPQYKAWGYFVVSEMQRLIGERLQDAAVESFLRIPPKARLKETKSLVDKAFYRGKPYQDPYQEITDKVGARFVVLLNDDVRVVEELLCKHGSWTARKDKDYEIERDKQPLVFNYQSLHYIVFSNHDLEVDGIHVSEGTPCEVQIRTLLQHAHSELSHSNLYKPNLAATPDMLRASAKSMALIEAADDYFDQVARKSGEKDIPIRKAKATLADIYNKHIGLNPDFSTCNTIILDALNPCLTTELAREVSDLLGTETYLQDIIRERSSNKLLFRQPVILLVYSLIKNCPAQLKELWPLSEAELRPLFTDMGVSFQSARR